MRKAFLVFAIILCVVLGGGYYLQTRYRDMHPIIYKSEKALLNLLENPNSYKMIKADILFGKGDNDLMAEPFVRIKFSTKNAHGKEQKRYAHLSFDYRDYSDSSYGQRTMEKFASVNIGTSPLYGIAQISTVVIDYTVFKEKEGELIFLSPDDWEKIGKYSENYKGIEYPVKITSAYVDWDNGKPTIHYEFENNLKTKSGRKTHILTYDPSKKYPYE